MRVVSRYFIVAVSVPVAVSGWSLGACSAAPTSGPDVGAGASSGSLSGGSGSMNAAAGSTTGTAALGSTGTTGTTASATGSGSGAPVPIAEGSGGGTTARTGSSTGTTTGAPATDASVSAAGAEGGVAVTGSAPGADAAVVVPSGCALSSPVGFTRDVQPFLATSCGNGSAGGCHVLDADSTTAEGGYNHAYDWITGTAHASSCPEIPTPFRFQVVIAAMQESDPPSCSKCPLMPITSATDPRTPLTACQWATLQSWLDEPYVTQLHRVDGISPTTPYAMPPPN